jgi:endonuclease-3
MDRKRACEIVRILHDRYPVPPENRHFLRFDNPFQILVLTILSAQTTDRAVNEIAGELFSRYPTPEALASAEQRELENLIRRIGLYRNKARNIRAAARKLVEDFDGEVPRSMDELLSLPGVGRKTANIVLNHAFGMNAGIAVDTHVRRVSYRTGLTDSTNPDTIERDLMALFPRKYWGGVNYLMIRHGREICTAKNPQCGICSINPYCRYYRELTG